MPDLAMPRNEGFKFRMLRLLARAVQRFRPMGIERVLRVIYHPDRRQNDHIDVAIEYDTDLLINVDTAEFLGWILFFYGCHEPEISGLIKRVVKTGHVAFDVGANIGCFSLIMGRSAGETGRIIAVEPNPRVYARLSENIRLNRMKNIEPLQCGLSDAVGEFTLYIPPDNFPNQGISSLYPHPELTIKIPVDIQTVDSIMEARKYDRLDFVKIDAQGNDYKVLLGGAESIRKYKPYVVFEYDVNEWGTSNVDFALCEGFFHKQEYTLYVLDRRGIMRSVRYGVPKCANILAVPPIG
jgi:FkbM family methyltransferase